MKPSLVAILLLLVCLPLGLLVWLGEERTRSEQERARASLQTILKDRLLEVRVQLTTHIADVEAKLDALLQEKVAPKDLVRSEPLVRHFFMTSGEALLIPPPTNRTAAEEAFLDRAGSLSEIEESSRRGKSGYPVKRGWHTWYHGNGRNFLYWNNQISPPATSGFEVDQSAFLSELIQSLPTDALANGRIVLLDESSYPIYQWGRYEPSEGAARFIEIPAPVPLESWRLAYFVPEAILATPSSHQSGVFKAGLVGLGALILLLGGYFYWANSRAMREASQRVSFVNQVSHELKTPLTNIRLYAELAETKLDPNDEETQGCLDVVVAESGRLSRLIQNVLTFAEQQRENLTLHASEISPDEVISNVIETFQPAFTEATLIPDLHLKAETPLSLDRDVCEQILSNLVSNVLKYALEVGMLSISSQLEDGAVVIRVQDHGPGVPANWKRRIFTPFIRMSDRVTDGVAGTGIGLSIARDLAERRGGSLELESTNQGATFRVTLRNLAAS